MTYEKVCRDNFKAASTAEWEIKTQGTIEHNVGNIRYNAIRQADAQLLNERRRKLAGMLEAESEAFQQQLEALEESPAQRKARMEARAGQLKDKREAERCAFVRQQYERQWRMACDPLRKKESEEILKATNAARAFQIGEKMKALEMDEQEHRAFDEMWERDRLAKLGREEAEEAARKQMDLEHKLVLDRQVSELHGYRANETELAAVEASQLQKQWDYEKEEAKKVEGLRHEVLMQAHDELHEFNKLKKDALATAVTAERQADRQRLEAQLALEAHEEEREAAARASMQHETRRFAEHMMAQKREIARREDEQEAARKVELDKAWDKRLAVWGKEQHARENLMAQVLDERKQQVEMKLQSVRVDKQNQADARHRLEHELVKVNTLEKAKLDEAQYIRNTHRALLEGQVKEKAFKRAAAEFNKNQEKMAADRAEAAYQMMLHDQMAKTTTTMQKFGAGNN